ncbi:MAG: hypothetical protein ACKOXB_15225 [Flavobacteriales bacterium]
MNLTLHKKHFLPLLFACCLGTVHAQTDRDSASWDIQRNSLVRENTSDEITAPVSKSLLNNFLSGLNTGGYYRGFFYNREMQQLYQPTDAKHVNSVGDGYYDPVLFLYVGGSPAPGTSFGTEVILGSPFTLYRGPAMGSNGNVGPFFSAVLRGGTTNKHGNFNIVAGGIEWMRLTPFTFGSNVGYNRYSIYERRPWDPSGNIKSRYASYYYKGSINQDARFGSQAFKGFMMNGFIKKLKTNFDIFYGHTAINGGISREIEVRPAQNLGVRLKRNLKKENYVSLNTFNSFARTDSVNSSYNMQWNIFTSEFALKIKDIALSGEVGMGRYMSPTSPENWSEGILLDVNIPKKYTFIPIDLRYFQIGKSFTSNVASFNNTTVSQVNSGPYSQAGAQGVLTPFGPGMDNVGDLANNRRGAAINTNFKVWKFMVSTGTQISAEMENIANATTLNYSHRINGLLWSRLPGVFPLAGGFGPNKRVHTFYRGAYEKVNLTDINADSSLIYTRYFNSFDFQVKFKSSLFRKDLYINYLTSLNSVQKDFSAFTKFDYSAYIRGYYHEIDVYYQLHKNFVLTLYGGLEVIKCNGDTDLDITSGLPRDQVGQAIGAGFDLTLSNQATLYFRERYFSFIDHNFAAEKFSGTEGTVELKIMF